MSDELDTARLMKIIDHPVRMKIIELLATNGPLTWKQLSGHLGTGTGALYYHVDELERIVTRDQMKRYALTKLGEEIYRYLLQNPSPKDERTLSKVIQHRTAAGTIRSLFIPRGLITLLGASKVTAAASVSVFSAVTILLAYFSGVDVILFSFGPSSAVGLSVGSTAGSEVAVVAVAYTSIRGILKQKPDLSSLLVSTALSFLPVTAFAFVLHSLLSSGITGQLSDRTILAVVLAAFQAWSVAVLSSGMSVSSGQRIEKTLMVGLILLYVSMSIVFIQGRLL